MRSLIHIYNALGYSLQGLKDTIKNEISFRLELIMSLILIPIAILLSISLILKILLISSVFLVLIVELINSAIESSINRISKEKHPLSGRAKDAGSAAVFVSIFNLIIVWSLILFDLIFNYS